MVAAPVPSAFLPPLVLTGPTSRQNLLPAMIPYPPRALAHLIPLPELSQVPDLTPAFGCHFSIMPSSPLHALPALQASL